jgi:sulfate adenylyltransferase subunit 1
MDLVDFDQNVFRAIADEFQAFAAGLGFERIDAVPLSALAGDMVVDRGERLAWYDGPTLLGILEDAEPGRSGGHGRFFFPVQWVARPGDSGVEGARGYSGRIESGTVRTGDAITVLPSGRTSRVRAIRTFAGDIPEAIAGQSVTIVLEDQLDVSRGDVLSLGSEPLSVAREFEATLTWFNEEPLGRDRRYLVKHGTRVVKAVIGQPRYRIDVNTLAQETADTLHLNDIGRVVIRTAQPLAFEPYTASRAAGSFIVIDEATNETVAAGLLA